MLWLSEMMPDNIIIKEVTGSTIGRKTTGKTIFKMQKLSKKIPLKI